MKKSEKLVEAIRASIHWNIIWKCLMHVIVYSRQEKLICLMLRMNTANYIAILAPNIAKKRLNVYRFFWDKRLPVQAVSDKLNNILFTQPQPVLPKKLLSTSYSSVMYILTLCLIFDRNSLLPLFVVSRCSESGTALILPLFSWTESVTKQLQNKNWRATS